MVGIWCLLFLGRFSMFVGWYDLIKNKLRPNKDFVSADAHVSDFNKDPRSYEMLASERNDKAPNAYSASTTVTPVSPPAAKSGRETPDYFGREARYKSPSRSFSSPKPPSAGQSWDSSQTYAAPASTYYTGMDPLSMNKI